MKNLVSRNIYFSWNVRIWRFLYIFSKSERWNWSLKKITSENQSLISNHNTGFWKSKIPFGTNWSDTWCGIHSALPAWSKNIIFNVFWDVGVDFWDFQNFHMWKFWILEIFRNWKTLIDYTRELRDQMVWKSPDSCVSRWVDIPRYKVFCQTPSELEDIASQS